MCLLSQGILQLSLRTQIRSCDRPQTTTPTAELGQANLTTGIRSCTEMVIVHVEVRVYHQIPRY